MSIENVRKYLEQFGLADRVMELEDCSATVAQAAADLGCEEARIAKTMAFLTKQGAILVVMAGDARVNNSLYKAKFGEKAVMIAPDRLPDWWVIPWAASAPSTMCRGCPSTWTKACAGSTSSTPPPVPTTVPCG